MATSSGVNGTHEAADSVPSTSDSTDRKRLRKPPREKARQHLERVKELGCLYAFSELMQASGLTLPEICQGVVDLLPGGWQYPESTCACLVLDEQRFMTGNFRETAWKLSSPISVHGEPAGTLEVYYLTEKPTSGEGPFLVEERRLLNALAGRLGKALERWRAEAALRQSELLFHTLAQVSPVGIFRTDARGDCVYVNERWCEIAGISADAARGQGWARAIHPEDRERVFAEWYRSAQANRPFKMEYRFLRADGVATWVMGQAMREPGDLDRPGGYVGTITDITDHKAMDDALRARTDQLDALRAVSTEITRELNLPALLDLIVRRSIELVAGMGGTIYLWDESAQLLIPRVWAGHSGAWAQDGQVRLGEGLAGFVAERREGQIVNEYRRWPHARPFILHQTKVTAVVAEPLLYRDRLLGVVAIDDQGSGRRFTEQDRELLRLFAAQAATAVANAQLYAQVQRHAEELEEKVEERTRELRAANVDLEAFAYSVSHDLRSPLISIDGFNRLLQQRYEKVLDAQGNEYLQIVRAEAKRMGELIDALLSLARVSRQTLALAPVDLSALARTVADSLNQRDPDRAAEVQVEADLVVQGDMALLRVLVENLVGNAWKFTAHRRPASIEVGKRRNDAGETIYFVRDNGVGFDMAYAEDLFGPFRRLHSAPEFPGTGIGLATVKRIVERHGGRVWAEGAVDRGATFYFTIGLPSPDVNPERTT